MQLVFHASRIVSMHAIRMNHLCRTSSTRHIKNKPVNKEVFISREGAMHKVLTALHKVPIALRCARNAARMSEAHQGDKKLRTS